MSAHYFLVLGTRPEAIKLSPVVRALRARSGAKVTVCATGQHREMLDQILQLEGLEPDIDLDLMAPGQSLNEVAARLFQRLGPVLADIRPDRVIVQGDTMSAAMSALCAHYQRIPVAHVEAGLRSGDPWAPWPEEANRRVVTQVADMHFAPTALSAEKLLAEGVAPKQVHVTGNTVIDALLATRRRLSELGGRTQVSEAALRRAGGRRIVLVTCHRRENHGAPLQAVAAAIARIAERADVEVIWPTHPNPAVRAALDGLRDRPRIQLLDPLDYVPFVHLLSACDHVLTDSGGVQEEAPALGKPVLVLRDVTERPEGVAAGCARLLGCDADRIVRETARLLDDPLAHAAMARGGSPYGDGRAAERIADIVCGLEPADGGHRLQMESAH